jgi:glycosyltransferase involved in cell wall biosynthesis
VLPSNAGYFHSCRLSPGVVPITVVIPVRNSPGQLRQCLEALLQNDLTDVDILVIDDASTDGTGQVVQSVAQEQGKRLRCLRLPLQSRPAAARNEGMRQARTPYVLFLDADIILPPETISQVRETLAAHDGQPEVIGVMGVYSENIPFPEFISNFKNMHVCFLHKTTPTVSPYLHTPILCIRRDILEKSGGFDTSLATAEDFRLGLQLGSQGYRFIIDRRIRGIHLKRLSLRGLLKEDARRIRDLLTIQMDPDVPKGTYQAHRWGRILSILLPLPILVSIAVSFLFPSFAWIAAAGAMMFYASNLDLVSYVMERKGIVFGAKSAAFLYVEMLWGQIVLGYWIARRILAGKSRL